MDVFISWSGEKSHEVAKIIEKNLPAIISDADPWLSSNGISAGARWSKEIALSLESAQIGITCLTSDNQHEPWILFEAGAVAKLTDVGRAIVLRIDLSTTDVTGPLSQFQSVGLDEEGVYRLVSSVNDACSKPVAEEMLKFRFQAFWPQMNEQLSKLPSNTAKATTARTEKDMLEEILGLIRDQVRNPSRLDDPLKILSEMSEKRHQDEARQQATTAVVLENVNRLILDRDKSLIGLLNRRLGGIIPSVEEIKNKVCEDLTANRLSSAADALLDSRWSRLDGEVLVETNLSKVMLPLVVNAEAEKISIRAMQELGDMSVLRFSYLVKPAASRPS